MTAVAIAPLDLAHALLTRHMCVRDERYPPASFGRASVEGAVLLGSLHAERNSQPYLWPLPARGDEKRINNDFFKRIPKKTNQLCA
jgi:hypothetical protein